MKDDKLVALREKLKSKLTDLDFILGYGPGYDPLHVSALFAASAQEVDRLLINPLCLQNLVTYLPGLRGKKVGIIVKGCDSRSLVQLLQEGLISREEVTIFGIGCPGMIDVRKLAGQVPIGRVRDVSWKGSEVVIQVDEQELRFQQEELLCAKCERCRYPVPVIHDELIAADEAREAVAEDKYQDLQHLEGLSLQERWDYWQGELARCIRCYACRNACPMCVCRDHCLAESRDPHWLSQENRPQENLFFQLIHAQHLAGRCTECGECERACPMQIPVLALKRAINREIKDLFAYEAGLDPRAVPPLMTYAVREKTIKDKEW